jgi:integrase/recombinase XerC
MINEFLSNLETRNYSPHTLRNYRRTLETFINSLGPHPLQDATPLFVRKFLAAQGEISAATRLLHLSALKSFAKFLKRHHPEIQGAFIKTVDAIQGPRRPKSLPRALSEDDMRSVISLASRPSAERDPWLVSQDRALVLVLYGMGLRAAEIITLPLNADFSNSLIVMGKGQKERIVPVLPVVRQAVDTYQRLAPETNRTSLFQTPNGGNLTGNYLRAVIRGFREVLGLPDYATPHAFRHSFATHMHQNGADFIALSELLGHASARTTTIYTSVNEKSLLKTLANCYKDGRYENEFGDNRNQVYAAGGAR